MNDIDTENYPQKTMVVDGVLTSILTRAKSNVPSYNFEEPFSHNITSLAKCLRQRYYAWVGTLPIIHPDEPKSLNEDWKTAGEKVEQDIIEIIKRAGIFRGAQIRVRQSNPPISGAIDAMIELDDKLYPVEIKSAKSERYFDTCDLKCPDCKSSMNSWAKWCKCGYNGRPESVVKWLGAEHKVSWEYYCQIQMYMYFASNAQYRHDGQIIVFDQGFMWYKNKNAGEMTIHKVDYDQDCIDWQLNRTRKLMEMIWANQLPDRDYKAMISTKGIESSSKTDWQCRFCDWKYVCWHDEISSKDPTFFDFTK